MHLNATSPGRAAARIPAVVLVVVLVLGGCGGPGDDMPGAGEEGQIVGPTPGGPAPVDEADAALLDADMPVPDGCEDAVEVIAGVSGALAAVISGQDVSADIRLQVDQIDQVLPRLPESIRDDVTVVASTIRDVADDFAALEFDPTSGATPPPEAGAVVEELTQRLQSPEYAAASQEISAFFEQGCPA